MVSGQDPCERAATVTVTGAGAATPGRRPSRDRRVAPLTDALPPPPPPVTEFPPPNPATAYLNPQVGSRAWLRCARSCPSVGSAAGTSSGPVRF